MKLNEVGVAGCCGAMTGLSISYAYNLNMVLWPLVSAIIAAVAYKPWQIWQNAGEIAACFIQACKRTPAVVWHAVIAIRKILAVTLFVYYFVSLGLAGIVLPFVAYAKAGFSFGEHTIVCILLAEVCIPTVGYLFLIIGKEVKEWEGRGWRFPMYGHLVGPCCVPIVSFFDRFFLEKSNIEEKEGDNNEDKAYERSLASFYEDTVKITSWSKYITLPCRVFLAVALSSIAVFLLPPLLLCDFILTLSMMSATDNRISAMIGGTLGCTCGALLMGSGLLPFWPVLPIAGIVGYGIGPLSLRLRAWLSETTLPATVS